MLTHTLILAAALLQPQATTLAPGLVQNSPKTEVLIWPNGVPPLGIDHQNNFGNHGMHIIHREVSGEVELHQTTVDVLVIQSGEATLAYGGEGVGMHATTPYEMRGTSIKAGSSRRVVAGDVIHIPAGIPHQFILAPGQKITYLTIKVLDPPDAK